MIKVSVTSLVRTVWDPIKHNALLANLAISLTMELKHVMNVYQDSITTQYNKIIQIPLNILYQVILQILQHESKTCVVVVQ